MSNKSQMIEDGDYFDDNVRQLEIGPRAGSACAMGADELPDMTPKPAKRLHDDPAALQAASRTQVNNNE